MSKKSSTFAPAFEKSPLSGSPTQTNEVFVVGRGRATERFNCEAILLAQFALTRKRGRVVYSRSLENFRTERYRRFESGRFREERTGKDAGAFLPVFFLPEMA